MKNQFILFLLLIGLASSCSDQGAIDDQEIMDYLAANNLTAEKTEDGIYYITTVEGDGNFPNINNTVTVNYKGYLTDGTVFDENDGIGFGLWQVIKGWQKGIPLISTGGSAILIIPSELGYGSEGSGALIPGNAVLIFEVDLLSFI